jgi:hypothetical protein
VSEHDHLNDADDADDAGASTPASPAPVGGLSRRTLFRAGAGVAGVAVASSVALPQAFAAGTGTGAPRTNQNGNGSGRSATHGLAGARTAAALPPVLPGATVAQRGWANFRVSATSADPLPVTVYETFGLVFDGNGPSASFTETELDLPTGSMLARVDVYGATTDATSQDWTVFSQVIGNPDQPLASLGDISTDMGPGTVHGIGDYAASPQLIAPGEIINVAQQNSSAASAANGVIYQYYAPGAIVLIDPVRVYDTRAGFPPAVGPKTRLAAGTARPVDLTLGGAVPKGAKGALLNVTVANTGPAGWLVAYKNGLTPPATSTVNWNAAGLSVANSAITEVDADAQIAVLTNTNTEVVIDVLGYIP